jgi:ribonuclease HII
MEKLHINFPQYNFSSNMGYGTNEHWKAIKKFGIINEHRKTYKPIRYIITKSNNTIKTNV